MPIRIYIDLIEEHPSTGIKRAVLLLILFSFIGKYSLLAKDESSENTKEKNTASHNVALLEHLTADTAAYQGTEYGSFADVFDYLPGCYFFDRGAIGQFAEGSLFAGRPGGVSGLLAGGLLWAQASGEDAQPGQNGRDS